MADFCRYDKRHATASLQHACGRDKERRPRRAKPAEGRTKFATQVESLAAHITLKRLVSDKWWIPGRAFEPLTRFGSPSEKVAFVNQCPGRPRDRLMRRDGILLDTDAIAMRCEKLTVAA
jgi:hypothetical protein